jgi:YfiH family protein
VSAAGWLRDPVLAERGVRHGFGVRGQAPPAGLVRVRQVHGARVWRAEPGAGSEGVEADAILCQTPGLAVGVVTADCVPLLLADAAGRRVAAVHAGWRGLAAGVVTAALGRLADTGAAPADLVAAIGPHAGPCCYEVDDPVLDALRQRIGRAADAAARPGRPGHAWLDLGALVAAALAAAGVPAGSLGRAAAACTVCDPERFASYRRDGPRAGRLVHFVAARSAGRDGPETGRVRT